MCSRPSSAAFWPLGRAHVGRTRTARRTIAAELLHVTAACTTAGVQKFWPSGEGNGKRVTIGAYVTDLLLCQNYFETLFVRIPKKISDEIVALLEAEELPCKALGNGGQGGADRRAGDEGRARPSSVKVRRAPPACQGAACLACVSRLALSIHLAAWTECSDTAESDRPVSWCCVLQQRQGLSTVLCHGVVCVVLRGMVGPSCLMSRTEYLNAATGALEKKRGQLPMYTIIPSRDMDVCRRRSRWRWDRGTIRQGAATPRGRRTAAMTRPAATATMATGGTRLRRTAATRATTTATGIAPAGRQCRGTGRRTAATESGGGGRAVAGAATAATSTAAGAAAAAAAGQAHTTGHRPRRACLAGRQRMCLGSPAPRRPRRRWMTSTTTQRLGSRSARSRSAAGASPRPVVSYNKRI